MCNIWGLCQKFKQVFHEGKNLRKLKNHFRVNFYCFWIGKENNKEKDSFNTILPNRVLTIFPNNIIGQNDLFLFKKTALGVVL